MTTKREQLQKLFPETFVNDTFQLDKLLSLINEPKTDIFTWKGRYDAVQSAKHPPTSHLTVCIEESVHPDSTKNRYIEGDNLEVLKLLQTDYTNQVKMIYIDPPYNTGGDFLYTDTFKNSHTNWLNMMYPRLLLAKNLLREDGVIVINIDEHEMVNLMKIMQEIFSEDNELGVIIWDKRNPKGDAKGIAYQHEYIIFFAKNKKYLLSTTTIKRRKKNATKILDKATYLYSRNTLENANKLFAKWLQTQNFSGGEKAYAKMDEHGDVYQAVSMSWPNKKQAPADYFIPLIHPETNKPCPVPTRGWRNPPARMKQLLDDGLILFGKDEQTQPRRKYFLKDNMAENLPSLLYYAGSDDKLLKELDIPFETPKVVDICMEHIATFTKSDTEDIVLDFFSGSATTAHAVMKLNKEDGGNRRFMMVEIPVINEKSKAYKAGYKNICEIGKERLRRVGMELSKENEMLDVGFLVLKVCEED